MAGDYEEGYQYELIDGRLYVSPLPNLPEDLVEEWIYRQAQAATRGDIPKIINYVYSKARVFVPGADATTCPNRIVAAYHDFPLDAASRGIRWQDVSPLLVVEVLSPDDPNKDLVRNVDLYLQVPSIKEYWISTRVRTPTSRPCSSIAGTASAGASSTSAFGETYTTRLLPGFELILDPRKLSLLMDLSLDYLPRLPRRKDFRIGCIGAGFIMRDCHLVAYRQAGFNPVAIASRNPDHAQAVAEQHGIPRCPRHLRRAAGRSRTSKCSTSPCRPTRSRP